MKKILSFLLAFTLLSESAIPASKLRSGTSGMNSEINDKIDEMLGSISGKGGKVISFVSDKNTNVSAVQFVLKTDSINLPEAQKAHRSVVW